jgi:hypothetical protein
MMLPARALGALALLASLAAPLQACYLMVSEHRSGRVLTSLPLHGPPFRFDIAFTHSVLNTPVRDKYEWRAQSEGGQAWLLEEVFEGQGYGLPYDAQPGQHFRRVTSAEGERWQLTLNRRVHPLVVPPVRSQQMRIEIAGLKPVLLESLSKHSVLIHAVNCLP